jgi:hypothetical protein
VENAIEAPDLSSLFLPVIEEKLSESTASHHNSANQVVQLDTPKSQESKTLSKNLQESLNRMIEVSSGPIALNENPDLILDFTKRDFNEKKVPNSVIDQSAKENYHYEQGLETVENFMKTFKTLKDP